MEEERTESLKKLKESMRIDSIRKSNMRIMHIIMRIPERREEDGNRESIQRNNQ